jgi:hypothetical protein
MMMIIRLMKMIHLASIASYLMPGTANSNKKRPSYPDILSVCPIEYPDTRPISDAGDEQP